MRAVIKHIIDQFYPLTDHFKKIQPTAIKEIMITLIIWATIILISYYWLSFSLFKAFSTFELIKKDMNNDNLFTISDVLLIIKELLYAPGINILYKYWDTDIMIFLEARLYERYSTLTLLISCTLYAPFFIAYILNTLTEIHLNGFKKGIIKGHEQTAGVLFFFYVIYILFG